MPFLGLILVFISLFVTTFFWLLPIIFVRFPLTTSLRCLPTEFPFLLLTLCCSPRGRCYSRVKKAVGLLLGAKPNSKCSEMQALCGALSSLAFHYSGETGLSNRANVQREERFQKAETSRERFCDRWPCRCTHCYIVVEFLCETPVRRMSYRAVDGKSRDVHLEISFLLEVQEG